MKMGFAVLLLGCGFAVATQLDRDPLPPYRDGKPPIGSKVPEFTLKDVSSKDRALSELSSR